MWGFNMCSVDSVELEGTEIERKHLEIFRANQEFCDIQTGHQWTCVTEQGMDEFWCCGIHTVSHMGHDLCTSLV